MAKGISGADRFNFMMALTGHLIANRRQSLGELAKRFGVSEAEIRSAAVTISLSGVGKYRPDELFFLDYDLLDQGIIDLSFAPTLESVPRLSAKQATAIALGLGYLAEILQGDELLDVKKLLSALGEGSATLELNRTLATAATENLQLVRRAIAEGRLISCQYRNTAGLVSAREIAPHSLVSQDAVWYLRGYCLSSKAHRVFRLDRMRETALTTSASEIPVAESEQLGLYGGAESETAVLFEVQPDAFGFLADFVPGFQPTQLAALQTTVPIADVANLGRIIARYGSGLRVLAPSHAVMAVADFARRALGANSTALQAE